mgnify:CR=1 FL=1
MKKILVKDILEVTKGKLIIGNENLECENFSKDTRNINEGDIYLAIKGANFDGNIFWKEALEKGASAVIVQDIDFNKEDLEEFRGKTIIKVYDTLNALYSIASFKRSLYNIPIIAVTGSVGKTSTKDIIASVMSKKYKTLKTEGNNNNNLGLPFTILKLQDHEAAVLEMGMNHLGEIELLSKIAKPTISVITNVGTSHIGNLGSRQNILKAKLEILAGMKNKKLIINNDNDLLNKWNLENGNEVETITYGIENESEFMAKNIKLFETYSEFICKNNNTQLNVTVPVGGIHFIYNALCAICVGKENGIEYNEIVKGIQEFELTKRRMDIQELANGVKIINDTYNASFESMQATLKYLGTFKQNRKIAVLGDMLELGEFSKELHENVGKEVVKNNIDILICLGKNAKYIVEQAKKSNMDAEKIVYLNDANSVVKYIKDIWTKNDVILFKASNGMRFFDIVDKLKEVF